MQAASISQQRLGAGRSGNHGWIEGCRRQKKQTSPTRLVHFVLEVHMHATRHSHLEAGFSLRNNERSPGDASPSSGSASPSGSRCWSSSSILSALYSSFIRHSLCVVVLSKIKRLKVPDVEPEAYLEATKIMTIDSKKGKDEWSKDDGGSKY